MESWQLAILLKPLALAAFCWAIVFPLRRLIMQLMPAIGFYAALLPLLFLVTGSA